MLRIIRRFGIQAAFIAMLCACGSAGSNDKPKSEYKGPVEGFVSEGARQEICRKWDAACERVDDEAEIRFPGAKSSNSVVEDWKRIKLALYAHAIFEPHNLTFDQFCNVLNEGKHNGWTKSDRIPKPVDTDSARAFRTTEEKAKADKEAKIAEEKRVAAAKAAEEKRLAERTPEQKTKDDAAEAIKKKEQEAAKKKAEEDRINAERADAERRQREKAKADAETAIAKKARDEIDAAKLLDKVFSRDDLEAIVKNYPGTAAGAKAIDRLKKLDKK